MTTPETPAVGVKIKPLVWEKHPMGWVAAPPTGHAYIIDIRIKDRVMFIKGMNPPPQCSNVDEAKAKAQADYESRIRSAIEPVDTPALVAAAYEAAARRCRERAWNISREQADAFAAGDDYQGNRLHAAQCAVLELQEAIRKLTPADAQARLDARLRDARNEGIEAAVKVARDAADEEDGAEGYLAATQIADALEALKTTE